MNPPIQTVVTNFPTPVDFEPETEYDLLQVTKMFKTNINYQNFGNILPLNIVIILQNGSFCQ
jgi:hypothetical protein